MSGFREKGKNTYNSDYIIERSSKSIGTNSRNGIMFSGVAGWEKLPKVRLCGHKSSRVCWRNATKSIVPFRRIQLISTSEQRIAEGNNMHEGQRRRLLFQSVSPVNKI